MPGVPTQVGTPGVGCLGNPAPNSFQSGVGGEGECVVADFPGPGETVTLQWQQTSQDFVIVGHAVRGGEGHPPRRYAAPLRGGDGSNFVIVGRE